MKLPRVLIIILAVLPLASYSQKYRLTYTGMPELYETIDIIPELKKAGGSYSKLEKGYNLSTSDGTLKNTQFRFDRQYIHNQAGITEFTLTHNNETQNVQLTLPTLTQIRFNLYADSIKPVLNYYLNVEGIFSNGKIYPLDTNFINITASNGNMSGSEWIKPSRIDFEQVTFVAICKYDVTITATQTAYIKKAYILPDKN